MKRSSKSKAWMRAHVNDPHVKQAQVDGYRSRAAYKLIEMAERDDLLKPAMTVIDLGCAPGSWTQVAASHVGRSGLVIGLDILPMEPLPGVVFLQGDFTLSSVLANLEGTLAGRTADLVMSDMSPNMSGVASADQVRSVALAELALDFAQRNLKPGGHLLVKVFQGSGFDEFVRTMRKGFRRFNTRKPLASRPGSSEVYLLGRGKV